MRETTFINSFSILILVQCLCWQGLTFFQILPWTKTLFWICSSANTFCLASFSYITFSFKNKLSFCSLLTNVALVVGPCLIIPTFQSFFLAFPMHQSIHKAYTLIYKHQLNKLHASWISNTYTCTQEIKLLLISSTFN